MDWIGRIFNRNQESLIAHQQKAGYELDSKGSAYREQKDDEFDSQPAANRLMLWWVEFCYYAGNASREARKRKFIYTIGWFSCMSVVFVAAVLTTVFDKASVIFAQQAESAEGQIDLHIDAYRFSRFQAINHTVVKQNVDRFDGYTFHSPRTEYTADAFDYPCYLKTVSPPFALDPYQPEWKYYGVHTVDYHGPPIINKLPGQKTMIGNDTHWCGNSSLSCMGEICQRSSQKRTIIRLIDTKREQEIGAGRAWPFGVIPEGEAILRLSTAINLRVNVGATFYVGVHLPMSFFPTLLNIAMRGVWVDYNTSKVYAKQVKQFGSVVLFPVKVAGVARESYGKWNDDTKDGVIMEIDTFLPYIVKHMHPNLNITDIRRLLALLPPKLDPEVSPDAYFDTEVENTMPVSIKDYLNQAVDAGASCREQCTGVIMNLPPPREKNFMSPDYDSIQKNIVSWASNAMYYVGYPEVEVSLGILEALQKTRYFSMLLGLILNIILTVMCVLATMLIYSLLMISVSSRIFELGVLRMVGMQTKGIVKQLVVQAFSYSIPAWVMGLIFSQIAASVVLTDMEESVHIPLEKKLTSQAVLLASVLGLLIPAVSVILPIREALNTNLQDALDTRHSKTKAVKFNIERSEGVALDKTVVVVGLTLFIFGGAIYYLLPLALLSFNLNLVFDVFFALLLSMFLALVILSLNAERTVERFVMWFSLWWETRTVKHIISKNLSAHRVRNRKTTVMYALAVGFIVFITVAYDMEIKSAKLQQLRWHGTEINVLKHGTGVITAKAVHEIEQLVSKLSSVAAFSWVSQDIADVNNNKVDQLTEVKLTNVGHITERVVGIHAVSPNFANVALKEFQNMALIDDTTALTITEQLYTVRGGQSALLSANFRSLYQMDSLDSDSVFLYALQNDGAKDASKKSLHLPALKPLAFMETMPGPHFQISQYPPKDAQQSFSTLVSFPTYARISKGAVRSVRDIEMNAMLLKFKDDITDEERKDVLTKLQHVCAEFSNVDVYDYQDYKEAFARADEVMGLIFTVATGVVMFFCLFGLVASMYSNIYEQSKEIAVMRAVGLNLYVIVRIFVYEAYVLVFSASLLGVVIGWILGWTMLAQRALFTELPVPMVFPWKSVLLVFALSIVCAVLSVAVPTYRMIKLTISSTFRSVD